MLDHWDGYLPTWAETTADWEQLNNTLYDSEWQDKYPHCRRDWHSERMIDLI
jgi:hypothetical protein